MYSCTFVFVALPLLALRELPTQQTRHGPWPGEGPATVSAREGGPPPPLCVFFQLLKNICSDSGALDARFRNEISQVNSSNDFLWRTLFVWTRGFLPRSNGWHCMLAVSVAFRWSSAPRAVRAQRFLKCQASVRSTCTLIRTAIRLDSLPHRLNKQKWGQGMEPEHHRFD